MPIWRTVVEHTYGTVGGPGYNVWHFRTRSDAPTTEDELTQASLGLSQFYTDLRSLFPTQSTHRSNGEWSNVDGEQYVPPITGWSVPGTADATQGYLPTAAALTLGWRTSVASGRGRGRTFLSPLSRLAGTALGTPTSAVLTAARSACDGLIERFDSGVGSESGAFGVYSREDAVIRDFVGYQVRNEFAVLRSRRD